MPSLLVLVAGALVPYILLCRHLRHQRTRSLAQALGYANLSRAELYSRLTLTDAERINLQNAELEFPRIYYTALQFALFRTYAIPTISRILKRTRQLAEPEFAGKRYQDTVALIAEMTGNTLSSSRAGLAIARMNWLHGQHKDILPRDILYTLLLFATQPPEFIKRFEWRQPTELELAAQWKVWFEIGLRMGIPEETIPKSYEAMVEAYHKYEEEYMVPATENNYIAERTMDLLIYWVPGKTIKRGARKVILALLDERLRTGMMVEAAPDWLVTAVHLVVEVRKLVLRNLCLPRMKRFQRLMTVNGKGRYNLRVYENEPWYVKGTLWGRWGPWGLIARIGGWPLPGDEKFGANGYKIEEMGPGYFEGKGRELIFAEAKEIQKMEETRGKACPFG